MVYVGEHSACETAYTTHSARDTYNAQATYSARDAQPANMHKQLGDNMEIITAPNPILRQKCEDVNVQDEPNLKQTLLEMAELMYSSNGCGLAGPQVGILKKIAVVDCEFDGSKHSKKRLIMLVNPKVKSSDGAEIVDDEGCLSIPGITIPVSRPNEVVISAQTVDGEHIEIEASGFYARCLQHEIDHLSGITLFETLNGVDRLKKLEEYKEALQNNLEQ